MPRLFLLLLIALICVPAAFAQSSDKDYSFYEFYVGYAHMRAYNNADHFDNGGNATFNGNRVDFADERTGYNGFTAEFNQNVHRNIGIVTSFTGTFDDVGYADLRSDSYLSTQLYCHPRESGGPGQLHVAPPRPPLSRG